jgi:hypothetical protein
MVLLTGMIHQVRTWDGLRWHDIQYEPSFMKIGEGVQAILRFCLKKWEAVMLVLLMGVSYELRR